MVPCSGQDFPTQLLALLGLQRRLEREGSPKGVRVDVRDGPTVSARGAAKERHDGHPRADAYVERLFLIEVRGSVLLQRPLYLRAEILVGFPVATQRVRDQPGLDQNSVDIGDLNPGSGKLADSRVTCVDVLVRRGKRRDPHMHRKVVHHASLFSRSPMSLSIIATVSGSLPSRTSQSNSLRSRPWVIRSSDSRDRASRSTRMRSRSLS